MIGEIFVSRPAALPATYELDYRKWLTWATASGLQLTFLSRVMYGPDPWDDLRRLLISVDGALIFGFRQLEIHSGTWRGGTPEERCDSMIWTSPWTQLEAGMAIMAGLPVLVVADRAVSEGVLSPDTWTGQVSGTELTGDTNGYPVRRWLRSVTERFARRQQST